MEKQKDSFVENIDSLRVDIDEICRKIEHYADLSEAYRNGSLESHPMSVLIHNHNLAVSSKISKYITRKDTTGFIFDGKSINDSDFIVFDEKKDGIKGAINNCSECNGSVLYHDRVYIAPDEYFDVLYTIFEKEFIDRIEETLLNYIKKFLFPYKELIEDVSKDYSSREGISNDNIFPNNIYDEGFARTMDNYWGYNKDNQKTFAFETNNSDLEFIYNSFFEKFYDCQISTDGPVLTGVEVSNKFSNIHDSFLNFKVILDKFFDQARKIELMKDLELNQEISSLSQDKESLLDNSLTIYSRCEDLLKIWKPISNRLEKYNESTKDISITSCLSEISKMLEDYQSFMGVIVYPKSEYGLSTGLELSNLDPADASDIQGIDTIDYIRERVQKDYPLFVEKRLDNIFTNIDLIAKQFKNATQLIENIKKSCKLMIKSLQTKEDRSIQTGSRRVQELLKSYKMIARLKTDQSYYSISDHEFNSWINSINEAHKDLLKLSDVEVENAIEIKHTANFKKKMNYHEYKKYVQSLKIKSKLEYNDSYEEGKHSLYKRPDITYAEDWPGDKKGWNDLLGIKLSLDTEEWAALAKQYINDHKKIHRNATITTEDGIQRAVGSWWYRQVEKKDDPVTINLKQMMETKDD